MVEGASTAELDALAHAYTADILGATSAPLGYGGMFALPAAYCDLAHAGLYAVGLGGVPVCGFPGATCISVNEVVCHGVPGPRRLARGDIVNIDVTVIADGFHGDTSRMIADRRGRGRRGAGGRCAGAARRPPASIVARRAWRT